jgi:hypothetical protein
MIGGQKGVDSFFAGGFGRGFFDFVEEFDAFFVLFFHDKVDAFQEDLVL